MFDEAGRRRNKIKRGGDWWLENPYSQCSKFSRTERANSECLGMFPYLLKGCFLPLARYSLRVKLLIVLDGFHSFSFPYNGWFLLQQSKGVLILKFEHTQCLHACTCTHIHTYTMHQCFNKFFDILWWNQAICTADNYQGPLTCTSLHLQFCCLWSIKLRWEKANLWNLRISSLFCLSYLLWQNKALAAVYSYLFYPEHSLGSKILMKLKKNGI